MKTALHFTLRNGMEIPVIGFGPGIMGYSAKMRKQRTGIELFTWKVYNKLILRPKLVNEFTDAISSGLRNGFRLLDYSNAYGNIPLVGKAIKQSGVQRSELFITNRVSNGAQFKGIVKEEFYKSLEQLGIEYVDLYQFHWPVTEKFVDTWKVMVELKREGLVKVLGVANCHPHHIEALEQATGETPEINQVEVHPLFTQKPLINYCKSKEIIVEAYTPVGRYDDRLVRLPLLRRLEQKYHKDFVQIILRWHIQNGVIPVVRAMNPKHQRSNIDIFDFELSGEDMKLIDGININSRLRYDPDNCDFTIL